jgi:hypothetical protein
MYTKDLLSQPVRKSAYILCRWNNSPKEQIVVLNLDGYEYCFHKVHIISKNPPGDPANTDAGFRLIHVSKERLVYQVYVRPWGRLLDRRRHWIEVEFELTGIRKGYTGDEYNQHCKPLPKSEPKRDLHEEPPPDRPIEKCPRPVNLHPDCICLSPNGEMRAHFFDIDGYVESNCADFGEVISVYAYETCEYLSACGSGKSLKGPYKMKVEGTTTNTTQVYKSSVYGTLVR